MGKDKSAQRTKKNVRPSSSGRSAEMLGTAPINPFVSFVSLKDSMGVDEQISDSYLDPNFQVVLKKMNKKDGITKLKALQEFSQLCLSAEPDQVVAVLPFWPRLYSFLAVDVEHRVREAAHIAHRSVISKVKRNIAPYLKQLVGPWFVAQCDTYAPAATAATVAFNEAFPEKKLSEAIAFCQEEILNYIYENLVVHTPQTLCNTKTMTPEEIESKYIRTVISSLQGYGLYLARLTSDQLEKAKVLNLDLISNAKFWKFSKHECPQIRCAWFGALIALCQHAKFFICGEEKRVGQTVFGSLDENDATVLPVVWEAALVALVAMDNLMKAVSFEKLVLPKLLRVCREGGKGSAASIFPSLLPLLSKIPRNIMKDTTTFHNKFFINIRLGFSQRSVSLSSSESKAVANAFVECLQYVIQLNITDNDLFNLQLLQQHLLPFVCETVEMCKRVPNREALFSSVSRLLHSWGRSPEGSTQRELLHSFCCDLSTALKSMAVGDRSVRDINKLVTNFSKEVCQINENAQSTEDGLLHQEQLPLSDLLRSQVYFISCLLERKFQMPKVKFADNSPSVPEVATSEEADTVCKITRSHIINLGRDLCCCYLQCVIETGCPDYLPPLSSLIKILNSPTIYADLAASAKLTSIQELFSKYFIKWLVPQSPLFCRDSFSLCVPLLAELSIKDQDDLFIQLNEVGLAVNQLSWLVEENESCGGCALNWLRNPCLVSLLRNLSEEACASDTVTSAWDLFSWGFGIAGDGDNLFCHDAIQEVLIVILSHLETKWHSTFTLPSWTVAASKTVLKLYSEHSPFLRKLSTSERAPSIAFEICLWDHSSSESMEALSQLWKQGTLALARVHGHSSKIILNLCSAFEDSVLTLLYGRLLHSKEHLVHIASNLSQFVKIVANSFPNVEESKEKIQVCSLLLRNLFFNNDRASEDCTEEVSGLKDVSRLHRRGLESLADCVEPFHPGINSSQRVPKSRLTELVGAGYWGAIIAYVLNQLSSSEIVCDKDDIEFFSLEVFLELFTLHSDMQYIALHFSFTELGSALHQLIKDTDDIIKEMLSNMMPSTKKNIHELFSLKSSKIATCERAHKAWHCYLPNTPCESQKDLSVPTSLLDDLSLQNIDLSPLELVTERLLSKGSHDKIKSFVEFWIDTVHKLHIRHNSRFVSNTTIDTCALAAVCDTLRVIKFWDAVLTFTPELLVGRNWDQVMIAMATWIQCAYETVLGSTCQQRSSTHLSRKVCAFLHDLIKLHCSFNKTLDKIENGAICLVDSENPQLKDSLPREWKDVFASDCGHKILAIWSYIVENIKSSEESPPLEALLHQLGHALQVCGTEFLQSSRDSEVAFEPILKLAPSYLLHNLGSVRLTAFHLLYKIVPSLVKHDSESFSKISNADDEADGKDHISSGEKLSLLQLEDVLADAQTVVSTMLSDIRLGTSCTVQPFTDSYTYTSGYLLSWLLILKMCQAAESELTCQYAIWLKNTSGNLAETFLSNVFRLLPQEAFEEKSKKPLDYFSQQPPIADFWTSSLVEHMACNALYGILSQLPGLVRQWWTTSDPKSATLIERVVSKHFSPFISEEEMSAVAKMQDKTVENMSVRVHSSVREVVATYTVDDLAMELVVRLPVNHPLSPMIVEVGKRNAAAAVHWRRCLMQLTLFLTQQNGTLWDGLALWRNNVVRKYEGVEECHICFCVLSGSNFQLPKLSCRTCRKKFHSNCLYKWFLTSNKSTCPICRNLF